MARKDLHTVELESPKETLRTPPTTQPLETSADRRADPNYLKYAIREISDADLFAALDLDRPELRDVRRAVDKQDYPAAYRAWAAHWKTVASKRAMFMGDGGLVMPQAEAIESLQPRRDEMIKRADTVVAHNITGWGKVTIQHGPVVNFDADYGESGKYGFNYWGWATDLTWAYFFTKDEKYLATFDALVNQWYAQRNNIHGAFPNLDVVYYELGLGVRYLTFLEYYFIDFDHRAPEAHEHILKSVLAGARWLYEEEKRQYRRGNWQIIGSYGLSFYGLMLPEFREASQWVRMGSERMLQHAHDDFFTDGCHSERSPASYMVIAYRDPRNLVVLLQGRSEYAELCDRMKPLLENSLNFFLRTLPPDGILPGINDGSRAPLPLALMQDGVKLFNRQDMRWVQRGLLNADHITGGAPPTETSTNFPESGFTAMRSEWSKDARYLLINHGPTGGGHSHADVLDFSLHAFGQACAIDSGIGYTYDDPLQQTWYRHSHAHNMIVIDDDVLDRAHAQGRDVVWTTSPALDYFAATHYGYLQSKGIAHRRHFVFVRPNYWLIYDVVESRSDAGEHRVSWNLHSPTPMDAHRSGFASKAGPGMIVLPSATWKPSKQTGMASVRGIRSYEGKDFAPIDWLAFESSIKPAAPTTLGVLLFPFAADLPTVKFSVVKQDHLAAHFMVEHPDGADHIFVGEDGATLQSGDTTFSGACAVVRYQNNKPVSWAASRALTLVSASRPLVDSDVPADDHGSF